MGAILSRFAWWRVSSGPEDIEDVHQSSRDYETRNEKAFESYSYSPAPSHEAKELQRVQETTLEREKTKNDSGSTTERTQYTQYVETMKVQDKSDPPLRSFDLSAPEKAEVAEPEKFLNEELKHEIKVSENATDKLEGLAKPSEDELHCEIEVLENVSEDDHQKDITEAVVKIQAGVRGYLTRKALMSKGGGQKPETDTIFQGKETDGDHDAPECFSEDVCINSSTSEGITPKPKEMVSVSSAITGHAETPAKSQNSSKIDHSSDIDSTPAAKDLSQHKVISISQESTHTHAAPKTGTIVVESDEEVSEESSENESEEEEEEEEEAV